MTPKSRRGMRVAPPHVVLVDTNVLFPRDKQHVVAPAFTRFWNRVKMLSDAHLVVPDLVRRELIYQQASAAMSACTDAIGSLRSVSRITGLRIPIPVEESLIREAVEARFNEWLQNVKATLAPTPVDSIDWHSFIERAVWRQPPFEKAGQDEDHEKGFRDALILETVAAEVSKCSSRKRPAFISGDELLRQSILARFPEGGLGIFTNREEFLSHLMLLSENLTEALVEIIHTNAAEAFYSADNPNSLVSDDTVIAQLRRDYAAHFEDPTLVDLRAIGESWQPMDDGEWTPGPSIFRKREARGRFYWTGYMYYSRWLQRVDVPKSRTLAILLPPYKLLSLAFSIEWVASISPDGKLSRARILEQQLAWSRFDQGSHTVPERFRTNWGQRPTLSGP